MSVIVNAFLAVLMIGLEKYNKKIAAEIKRVETLDGGDWQKPHTKLDTQLEDIVGDLNTFTPQLLATNSIAEWLHERLCSGEYTGNEIVKDLPGGRYQALFPGPSRAGRKEEKEDTTRLHKRYGWEWELRAVLGRGASPVVSVTDLMDHIIFEGDRLFAGTDYADTWIIGHDHLSQWWSAASLSYLHGRGFGPTRYLCAQGKTNTDNKYYAGSLVGCRPELMPLDSHLNADHERGMLWHVALTSNLPNNDSRKFKMGTPGQVGDCMDRTWQVFPTSERIVSDINKFPKAVDAIIEADGAVVPELDTRTGRRSTLHLPHHPDCEESMCIREAKWNREQELFDSLSANVHITDSESEDSDGESDDEEDLDHSVVALDEGTV